MPTQPTPSPVPTQPAPSTPATQGNSLSGTWTGTLSSATTSKTNTIIISDAGDFVFSYQAKGGAARQVELTQVGQAVQALLASGSVMQMAVDSSSARRASYRSPGTAAWRAPVPGATSTRSSIPSDGTWHSRPVGCAPLISSTPRGSSTRCRPGAMTPSKAGSRTRSEAR